MADQDANSAQKGAAVPPSVSQEVAGGSFGQASSAFPHPVALFQGNPQFFVNNGRHSAPALPGAAMFHQPVAKLSPFDTEGSVPGPPVAAASAGKKKKKTVKKKAKQSKKKKSVRQVNKAGGKDSSFTEDETAIFLDLMEKHKPIGREAWEMIPEKHNPQAVTDRHRDVASPQRKWKSLHSEKM